MPFEKYLNIKIIILFFSMLLLPEVCHAVFLKADEVPFHLDSAYEEYFGPHPYNGVDSGNTSHHRVMQFVRWCYNTPSAPCWRWLDAHTHPEWTPTLSTNDYLNDNNNICPNYLNREFPKDVRYLILKYLHHYDTGEHFEFYRPSIQDGQYISVSDFKHVFAANIAHTFWMEVRNRVPWKLHEMVNRADNSTSRFINDYQGSVSHLLDARCLLREEQPLTVFDGRIPVINIPIVWNPRLLYEQIRDYANSWPMLPDGIRIDRTVLDFDGSPALFVESNSMNQNREQLVQLVRYFNSQSMHSTERNGFSADSSQKIEMMHATAVYPELFSKSGYVRQGCPGAHYYLRSVLRVFNTPVYHMGRSRFGHSVSFIPDLGEKGLGVFDHNDTLYTDWPGTAAESALDSIPILKAFVPMSIMQALDLCDAHPTLGFPACDPDDPHAIAYTCQVAKLAHMQVEYPNFGVMRRYCYDWCIENGGYWDCEFPNGTFSLEWGNEYTSNCSCIMHDDSECPVGGCGLHGTLKICHEGQCMNPPDPCFGGCPTGEQCHNGVCVPRIFDRERAPSLLPPIHQPTYTRSQLEGEPGFGGTTDPDSDNRDHTWDYPWWNTEDWRMNEPALSTECPEGMPIMGENFGTAYLHEPLSPRVNVPYFDSSIENPQPDSWISAINKNSCSFFFNYNMNLRRLRNKWKTQDYFQNDFGLEDRTLIDRAGNTIYLDWGEFNCISINGTPIGLPTAVTYQRRRQCGWDFDGNGPYVVSTNAVRPSLTRAVRRNSPERNDTATGLILEHDDTVLEFEIDRSNKPNRDLIITTAAVDDTLTKMLELAYSVDGVNWNTLGTFGERPGTPNAVELSETRIQYRSYVLLASEIGNATNIHFQYRYSCPFMHFCNSLPADNRGIHSGTILLPGGGRTPVNGDAVFLTIIKFALPDPECNGLNSDVDLDGIADGCDSCPGTHYQDDIDQDCQADHIDNCPYVNFDEDDDSDCIGDTIDNCSPIKETHQCNLAAVDCNNHGQWNSDYLTERQNGWEERGDACDDRPILLPLPHYFVRTPDYRLHLPDTYLNSHLEDSIYIPFSVSLPDRYSSTMHRIVKMLACSCNGVNCDNCILNREEFVDITYSHYFNQGIVIDQETLPFSRGWNVHDYLWNWKSEPGFSNSNRIMLRFDHWSNSANINRTVIGPINLPAEATPSPLPPWSADPPTIIETSSNWPQMVYSGKASADGYSRFTWNPTVDTGQWIEETHDEYMEQASPGMAVASAIAIVGRASFRGAYLPEEVQDEAVQIQFAFGGLDEDSEPHNKLKLNVITSKGSYWYDLSDYQRYYPGPPYPEENDEEEAEEDEESGGVDGNYVPQPRVNAKLFLDWPRKKLILVGGYKLYDPPRIGRLEKIKNSLFTQVDILDLSTMLWVKKANIFDWTLRPNEIRHLFEPAFRSKTNELWLFGGIIGSNAVGSAMVLDLNDNGQWRDVKFASNHPSRMGHSVTYSHLDDRFYLFGGINDTENLLEGSAGDVWQLDPVTEEWKLICAHTPDAPKDLVNVPIVHDLFGKRLIALQNSKSSDEITAYSCQFADGNWYKYGEEEIPDGDVDGDVDGDEDDPPPGGCRDLNGNDLIRDAQAGGSTKQEVISARGIEFILVVALPFLLIVVFVRRLRYNGWRIVK